MENPHKNSPPPGAPGPIQAWVSALRPRTLVAGVVPVAVGTALAMAQGQHHPGTTIACVGVSLLLQVGVNLHNDHADACSGADTEARLGPARATAQGWISPETVLRGAYLALAFAGSLGLYLVSIGGWPILAAGIASIVAALAYTGGPFPLGYRGLGEVLVFTFFGLVATAGTYFLHTGVVSGPVWWAASAIGALASAILVVNNLRDRETDRACQKNTLAVLLGPRLTRVEYTLLVAYPFVMCTALWASGSVPSGWLLPWVCLPLAGVRVRNVWQQDGPALNIELARTAQLELAFGLLLSLGVLL